jgi:hypothetical protein
MASVWKLSAETYRNPIQGLKQFSFSFVLLSWCNPRFGVHCAVGQNTSFFNIHKSLLPGLFLKFMHYLSEFDGQCHFALRSKCYPRSTEHSAISIFSISPAVA